MPPKLGANQVFSKCAIDCGILRPLNKLDNEEAVQTTSTEAEYSFSFSILSKI